MAIRGKTQTRGAGEEGGRGGRKGAGGEEGGGVLGIEDMEFPGVSRK